MLADCTNGYLNPRLMLASSIFSTLEEKEKHGDFISFLFFYPTNFAKAFVYPDSTCPSDISSLKAKQRLELGNGVVGSGNRVPNSPAIGVNLVVVTADHGLVAKEVDRLVLDAAGLLGLLLEVLEAVGLVPACGEDVKGDLASDGESTESKC